MEPVIVDSIRSHRKGLAHLITTIEPANVEEWKAFNFIVAAHKSLLSIDYDKISQVPFKAGPEVECPICHGSGQVEEMVSDGDDNRSVTVPCHICHSTGKVPASKASAEGVQGELSSEAITDGEGSDE